MIKENLTQRRKPICLFVLLFLFCAPAPAQITLYGVTRGFGTPPDAKISKYTGATNTITAVYSFGGEVGFLGGSLMKTSDDVLYSAITPPGLNNSGIIFSFNPLTSIFTNLYDFDGLSNGGGPTGGLVQGNNSKLYGTTFAGGNYFGGVIFSFDPSSNTFAKLFDLNRYNDGGIPSGSLFLASNNKLYGMTTWGGNNDKGVVFSFDPATSMYSKLFDFNGADGRNPHGNSLVQASNGKLYGMTFEGGVGDNAGVIFSIDPNNSVYTKLKDLEITDGRLPRGALIQFTDGKLYGMTEAGGNNDMGVIFSLDPSTSIYTKLKEFNYGNDGYYPQGSLLHGSDGKLYGMTIGGGANNHGVIFSFDPITSVYTKLQDFDGINGSNFWLSVSSLIEVGVAPTITTISLSSSNFCRSSSVNVHYTTSGSFNQGNIFTAQLSDASGSFASPINIGSVAGITNGNINATIPINAVLGSGYRIRVVASNPTIISRDNGSGFSIFPNYTVTIPDAKAIPKGVLFNTVYLGYSPASSIVLTASPSENSGSYTYLWSNGETSQTISVSPVVTTEYSVTITNASGCSVTASKIINVIDANCNNGKVYMCHITGNSAHVNTICIDNNAVAAHLAAGCSLGECIGSRNAPSAIQTEVVDFKIDILPNPSNNYFNLAIKTNDPSPISIRIMDLLGRVIEFKDNATLSESYRFGNNLRSGVYLAEIVQSKSRRVIKLIKL